MLKTLSVQTSSQTELVDITSHVEKELSNSGVEEGRLTLYAGISPTLEFLWSWRKG